MEYEDVFHRGFNKTNLMLYFLRGNFMLYMSVHFAMNIVNMIVLIMINLKGFFKNLRRRHVS
jgi:VanZ family protein